MELNAASVIESCLPDRTQRMVVLEQLVKSSQLAGSIAPSAWGVTLFDDGFRLNVGQVEVLALTGGNMHVLAAAAFDDPRLRGLNCTAMTYRSVAGPQCAFDGTVVEYAQAQEVIEPLHLKFVQAAAQTRAGNPRQGSPFTRHHSEALMQYAADTVAGRLPPHEPERPPFVFKVGDAYTRRDVFKTIGIPEPTGGAWFTGYASHGPDWFIFCGVGAGGRTGHDYGNYFEGERLVWFGKGPSTLNQPSIQDLLSPAGRVYVFYREGDRDPFTFAGVATADERFDETPVRVIWTFTESDGSPLASALAEEVGADERQTVSEGARKTIEVNVYERDTNARRKCIAHWGTVCVVCSFDFAKRYGRLGEGFIHVHHLRPLGEIGVAYDLDPIADLRPVCPNCHSMLHRRRPAMTIGELQGEMAAATSGRTGAAEH